MAGRLRGSGCPTSPQVRGQNSKASSNKRQRHSWPVMSVTLAAATGRTPGAWACACKIGQGYEQCQAGSLNLSQAPLPSFLPPSLASLGIHTTWCWLSTYLSRYNTLVAIASVRCTLADQ